MDNDSLAAAIRRYFGDVTGLGQVAYSDTPSLAYGTAFGAAGAQPFGNAYKWLMGQQPQWELGYTQASLANPNLRREEYIAQHVPEWQNAFALLPSGQRGDYDMNPHGAGRVLW